MNWIIFGISLNSIIMAPYIKDKRHLVGLIFVLIGLVLIIDNIRFIPHFIPWWIWSWQFLLIAIGGFTLLTSDKVAPGVILMGIGSVFLLSDILPDLWPGFFHLFTDDTNLFWYLVLIVVGVSLILKNRGAHQPKSSRNHSRRPGSKGSGDPEPSTTFTDSSTEDFVDEVAIFGGGKKVITSDNFRGGRVTVIFGGSDLILTQSQLAPGVNEIEVFGMFGGWTMVVPSHWQVKSEVVAVFGAITDKRIITLETVKDNTRQLVIKGFVMFGGGEIKSY